MLQAIIVDDEFYAVEKLAKMLEELEGIQVVGKYTNPLEALEQMEAKPCDVAFVDIEMPGINGITLADRLLTQPKSPEVVFVTAYSDYAIQAFEMNALDYLLKPVSRERLEKTLSKISKVQAKEKMVPAPKVKVECFGGFRVSLPGGERISWRTKKTEELFAMFINYFPKELSRDRIIDTLWPEMETDKAVVHFNTTLYNLKKVFNNYGIKDLIENHYNRYRVQEGKVACDLWEFERSYDPGFLVTEQNFREILDALTMQYGAALFEGYYYGWISDKQNYIEDLYHGLMMNVIQHLKSSGDRAKAIQLLYQAIERDPINEALHRELIRLYQQEGDRITAAKVLHSYQKKLKNMLGDEVETELDWMLE